MKFKPCNQNGCKNGYIITNENGIDAITPCQCRFNYTQNEINKLSFKEAGLPEKIWNYKITDYVGQDKNNNIMKINKFIEKFDEKYFNIHLYFLGDNGTQKSTVARYIVKELVKNGKTGKYMLVDEVLRDLTKLNDENKLINEEEMQSADILILDEFDAEKVLVYNSGYQISFLTSFLKTRLEKMNKSTIFISNNSVTDETFIKKFGKTISDMISREISDTLIFEDNYQAIKNDFDIEDLWS